MLIEIFTWAQKSVRGRSVQNSKCTFRHGFTRNPTCNIVVCCCCVDHMLLGAILLILGRFFICFLDGVASESLLNRKTFSKNSIVGMFSLAGLPHSAAAYFTRITDIGRLAGKKSQRVAYPHTYNLSCAAPQKPLARTKKKQLSI